MPQNATIIILQSICYALLIGIPQGIKASDKSLKGWNVFTHIMAICVANMVAIDTEGRFIGHKHAGSA